MKKEVLLVIVLALALAANVANADFTFGEPVNLGAPVDSSSSDGAPNISSDGLSLYFSSDRPGGRGGQDIWVATRPTPNDLWSKPINLGAPINSSASESFPSISSDGLTLYFSDFFYDSARPGGVGGKDIWMATRTSVDDPWGRPINLGTGVNSSGDDVDPTTSADGLILIFASNRGSGGWQYDLWMSTRPSTNDDWGLPVKLPPPVNGSSYDGTMGISADGLVLFFTSARPGGLGEDDLWLTTRRTIDSPWASLMNLGSPINTSVLDAAPDVSADGRMLYFTSLRSGGMGGSGDLWQVPIEPFVDLNGDDIVDAADMCIIVDNWGTDEPLCDIGPMPWGDGIVDVQDLIVLAEHLFEQIPPVE